MENVRKSPWKRFFVLVLVLCLLFVWAAQPAQAFALADDVVLALLVGALAAIGVTASAPTMAQLGTGLADLVDEWEIGQGIMSGTMFGIIATSAIALGAGAFQLGNAAWEKIQGFVDWLKGDKGLTEENNVTIENEVTLNVLGINLPISHLDVQLGNGSWQNLSSAGKPTNPIRISLSTQRQYEIQFNNGLVWGAKLGEDGFIKQYTRNGDVYSEGDGSQGKVENSDLVPYQVEMWISFGTAYRNNIYGLAMFTNFYIGRNNELNRNMVYNSYKAGTFMAINDVPTDSSLTINQDYPDDAEPLPYVPDLPLNVSIPGSNAGTLDQVAQDITAAVDAGTLEATGAEGADMGELNDYTVSLTSFFPFCIPFDLYNMISAFTAEPEAPYIEIPFTFSPEGAETDDMIVIDLSPFDSAARVLRSMELVLFCVGLALITRRMIKW